MGDLEQVKALLEQKIGDEYALFICDQDRKVIQKLVQDYEQLVVTCERMRKDLERTKQNDQ